MRPADQDNSAGGRAIRVRCLACGTWRPLVDMVADLDGPPFVAYFCRPAAERVVSSRQPVGGCLPSETDSVLLYQRIGGER